MIQVTAVFCFELCEAENTEAENTEAGPQNTEADAEADTPLRSYFDM